MEKVLDLITAKMRQAFAAESIMQAQQAEEPEERQDNEEQT